MKLADAHVHFFEKGYHTRYSALFPDGREILIYQALREAHQISDVLAVGYGEGLHQGNNRYLCEMAKSHSWVHPLAYCPAEAPLSSTLLRRFRQQRFVGISLYPIDAKQAEALLDWPSDLLTALNKQRAIVSLNVSHRYLQVIRPFLEKLEGCYVLLSHLGLPGFLDSMKECSALPTLSTLASLPHLGIKASGFYACEQARHAFPHRASHSHFESLLDAFGFQRLYWGSDFSPALEFVSFQQTIEILGSFNLSNEQRNAILGENLRDILKQQKHSYEIKPMGWL